jgi:glycosyltransferase involved in cell wall biosynthesis
MRIGHFFVGRTSLDRSGGAEKTVYYLSQWQARLGHEVELWSLTAKSVDPIENVEVYGYPPHKSRLRLPCPLIRHILDVKPDVVHMHSAYVPANYLLSRELRRRRIPYVITAHGNYSPHLLRRRPWLKMPYRLICELPIANNALFVHAIADRTDIVKYGVARPIVIAPNGLDVGETTKTSGNNHIRSRWPDLKDRGLCLFLGRLDIEQKGLDILIEAWRQVSRLNSKLALILVGSDWKGGESRLKAQVAALELKDSVKFWGNAGSEIKFDLLRESLMFLHASRWEAGIPFSVLEAMACRAPCIVTRAADPLGSIGCNRAGYNINGTSEDLAASILSLAELPEYKRAAMGEAALQIVQREFSWQQTAAILCKAYREHISLLKS